MELLHKELTDQIVKVFYAVYNGLGYGFKESIYENAMILDLEDLGLLAERQKPISVYYKGKVMGEYVTDITVEDKVILELKAQPELTEAHEAQLLQYLRATRIEVGVVLNFGPKPKFSRKVFSNSRKKLPQQP